MNWQEALLLVTAFALVAIAAFLAGVAYGERHGAELRRLRHRDTVRRIRARQ